MKGNKTKVRFYVDKDGEILAVFPSEQYNNINPHLRVCYAHIGQHSAASPSYYRALAHATPEEYKPLADELTDMGYDLEILNK